MLEPPAPTPGLTVHLQAAALVLARVLPVAAFTPVFGGTLAPRRFRFAVAALLTLALTPPLVAAQAPPLIEDRWVFAGLLLKEALVGGLIALTILVLFETLTAAGSVIDLARGSTIANVLDPLTQQQQSVLGSLYAQTGLVLFLAAGGHELLLTALADGFVALPTHRSPVGAFAGAGWASHAIDLGARLLVVSLQLAGPVVVLMLVLDAALGVLSRAAPQVQVFFVGLEVKPLLGLGVALLALHLGLSEHLRWVFDAVRQLGAVTPAGGG